MNKKQAQYLVACVDDKGVRFDTGLTNEELLSIESRFLIRIPPDLKLLLQLNLPVSDGFVNWRLGVRSNIDADKIISLLDWPLKGMLSDLQADDFWIKSWGNMPESYEEKRRIAKEKYPTLPKLIQSIHIAIFQVDHMNMEIPYFQCIKWTLFFMAMTCPHISQTNSISI